MFDGGGSCYYVIFFVGVYGRNFCFVLFNIFFDYFYIFEV